MMGTHQCDNCQQTWTEEQIIHEIRDLRERVEPNGVMPSGECPECGALCYLEQVDPLAVDSHGDRVYVGEETTEMEADMEPETVTCSVDENGRAIGFEYDGEIESFGTGLEGEEVTLDDGRSGTVSKVYGHIQTGNPGSGTSNYVAVEVTVDE